MKLRRPCEHGFYDGHLFHRWGTHPTSCPGGVFLPDDTLIIEKVDVDDPECGDCDHLPRREWPDWALTPMRGAYMGVPILNALAAAQPGDT